MKSTQQNIPTLWSRLRLHIRANAHHYVIGWVLAEIGFWLLRGENTGLYGDHPYYLAHFLSNRIYFQKNGFFHLPYYSPAFGGGLPEYANPQDMTFSIFQWFFNLTPNPFVGLKLGVILCLCLCYGGCYRFFRQFNIRPWISSVTAFIFSLNGFYTLNLIVGHTAYQSYWAIPWALGEINKLTDAKQWRDLIRHGLWLSLFINIMLYAGGLFVLLPTFSLSATLIMAKLLFKSTSPHELRRQFLGLSMAVVTVCCLGASKLLAGIDYTRQFPRIYPNEALGLKRVLWIIPNSLFNPFCKIGTMLPLQIYGWWENAAYVGFSILIFLGLSGLWYLWQEPDQRVSASQQTLRFFLVWCAIGVPITMYLFMGWNIGWFFLKQLPVLASVHVPSRHLAAMPILVLGLTAAVLNDLHTRLRKPHLISVLCLVFGLDILGYHAFQDLIFTTAADAAVPVDAQNIRIDQWIERGDTTPARILGRTGVIMTLDPLFKYDLSLIKCKVNPQLPPMTRWPGGEYNVNDPTAMAYPNDVHRPIWSLLPGSIPEEQVNRFLSFMDPGFYVPWRQKLANGLSLMTLLTILAALLWLRLSSVPKNLRLS